MPGDADAGRHEATDEALLRVLAGTIAMLPPQLAQLGPALRRRVGGPTPRALARWRNTVLALQAELAAERAEAAPIILHAPEAAMPPLPVPDMPSAPDINP